MQGLYLLVCFIVLLITGGWSLYDHNAIHVFSGLAFLGIISIPKTVIVLSAESVFGKGVTG